MEKETQVIQKEFKSGDIDKAKIKQEIHFHHHYYYSDRDFFKDIN